VQCLGQPTWHKQTFPGWGLNQEIRLVLREMWRIEELAQPPLGWPLWLKDQVCLSLGVSKFKQQEISGFLFTNFHKLSKLEGLSNTDGFGDRNYVFLLHSYINLCPWLYNHFCTLLWSMQASPFSYNELNTSNTKIIRNKKPKFLHNKLYIHTIIL
jgi:hypothetical protein